MPATAILPCRLISAIFEAPPDACCGHINAGVLASTPVSNAVLPF
jgi:hypothetical protein